MTIPLATGSEAQRLVRCAYGTLDLFGGRAAQLLAWSHNLSSEQPVDVVAPEWWAGSTAHALLNYLADAGVTSLGGAVDPFRLAQFQQVIELLPHFQAATGAKAKCRLYGSARGSAS
jgi:hypothetical protein